MSEYRTYAFRRLKGELTRLSRLKWVFSFSHKFLAQELEQRGTDVSLPITKALAVSGFDDKRLHATVGEIADKTDSLEDEMNLLLLVKACAGLEDFIHRFVLMWAVSKGYCETPNKPILNRLGKAVTAPAMVSSLESSLSYLELLLRIKFGKTLTRLGKAYKLRCIAAHNAALVDYEAVKILPELSSVMGTPIRLGWARLHEYLKAIGDAGETLEAVLSEKERKRSELQLIVHGLLKNEEFHPKTEQNVRRVLVKQCEFQNLPDRKHLSEMIDLMRGK
jgi:hypothetical protein